MYLLFYEPKLKLCSISLTKNHQIFMKSQKILNSQSNPEEKEQGPEVSHGLILDYNMKQQ